MDNLGFGEIFIIIAGLALTVLLFYALILLIRYLRKKV